MFNPLITNLADLTDDQLQKKIEDLQSKYFSAPTQNLKDQLVGYLEIYQNEVLERQMAKYQKEKESQDDTLFDELINIR